MKPRDRPATKPHDWALSGGIRECRVCGMRGTWEGAKYACRGIGAPAPLTDEARLKKARRRRFK